MTRQHFLHVILTASPEIWGALVFIGIPTCLFNFLLFHIGVMKLRFFFRTYSKLDGLSGLALLFASSSWLLAMMSLGVLEFFPKAPVRTPLISAAEGIGFFGGLFLSVVLRPYTKFGKPNPATSHPEEKP